MSLSTYFLGYIHPVGQLRRRRRAYAPMSNIASLDNHEQILFFPICGAPLGGPFEPLELHFNLASKVKSQKHKNHSKNNK